MQASQRILFGDAGSGGKRRRPGSPWRVIVRYGFVWTVILVMLLYGNVDSVSRHTREMLRQQARSLLRLVTQIRSWDKDYQGLQPPAVHSGRGSTPLSPVVMLSGIAGQQAGSAGATFRLVSIDPSRPAHRPDSWEKSGLDAFGRGRHEWLELSDADAAGKVFRYMAPLRVEQSCRSCHADPSFEPSSLRGGISVSVPAGTFLASQDKEMTQVYATYAFIWALGLCVLAIGIRRVQRKTADAERVATALRESEERFRRLFEDAPVAYHEIDRDGTVTRLNRAEADLLGYEPEEMIGRPVWSFVSPDAQAQSREAVRRKVSGEQPLQRFCREYTRRDGKRLILEVHEKLIRDAGGEVTGIRSLLLDVTERERAQQELAHRTEELARSNAELEQFAYVASHDLQEPLRKIMAFGDRLRVRCGAGFDEQGHDYLDRMRNAAGRMQVLINDLLILSRIKRRAQPFAEVDLGKVVKDVLSDLEVRIEQMGAQVETAGLPVIEADALQMSQMLQNLIGNALKFHKPGEAPVISIRGEAVNGRDEEALSGISYGPWCRITVEDNGIGFEEKYADRIFQVFQRLHGRNEYEGTGVGLAICRHIAERHKGTIKAHSSPGQGAKFILTLPVEQETEEPKA